MSNSLRDHQIKEMRKPPSHALMTAPATWPIHRRRDPDLQLCVGVVGVEGPDLECSCLERANRFVVLTDEEK